MWNITHIATWTTAVTTISVTTNQITARTLMSLDSCATSGLWRLPCACAAPSAPCVGPVMAEALLPVGIVERHERTRRELAGEEEQPHADEAERNRHVHPVNREAALIEVRRHDPDQVHEPHRQDEQRNAREQPRVPLQIAREQQAERQREVAEHQQQAHVLPPAAQADEVEGNLLRQVPRPDDQELR